MKQNRIFLAFFIALFILGSLYAQDAETPQVSLPDRNVRKWDTFPYSLGAGAEFGINSRDTFSLGYSAALDRYLYNPHTALGLRGTMYNDFATITATEAELTFRLYILELWNGAVFSQFGFGAVFYSEEERRGNTYIMDFVLGYRYYFQKGLFRGFYLEPVVRVGYPFEWSAGLFVGHWFSF